MTVNATIIESVTVNPANVRYSVNVDKFGDSHRGTLQLQRSEKRSDGTWMDDPHPDSRAIVSMPSDDATVAAWGQIETLLPLILSKLGIAKSYGGYRLQLLGAIDSGGILDVVVVVQLMLTMGGWQSASIPSLNAFLSENADVADSVLSAWASLDSAINAANATARWL